LRRFQVYSYDKEHPRAQSVLPVGNIKSEEFLNSSLFIIDDKLKFIVASFIN